MENGKMDNEKKKIWGCRDRQFGGWVTAQAVTKAEAEAVAKAYGGTKQGLSVEIDKTALAAIEQSERSTTRAAMLASFGAGSATEADQWQAIHRAALVAAANAIQSQDMGAKRDALAVATRAGEDGDVVIRAIFGAAGDDALCRYADLAAVGRGITSAQVVEAKAVIRAEKEAEQRRDREAERAASNRRPTVARPTLAVRLALDATIAAEKAGVARRDAEQRAEDLKCGIAALPEMVNAAIGCEWIEESGVILADDGREYQRLVISAVVATDIGRMLRCANSRASEVARLSAVMRSHIIKESV
jgi:hypothetical protein